VVELSQIKNTRNLTGDYIWERERKRDRATKLHSFWGAELPDGSIANLQKLSTIISNRRFITRQCPSLKEKVTSVFELWIECLVWMDYSKTCATISFDFCVLCMLCTKVLLYL
jgi:hypothetical protein